jgi:hypothetical protein
MGAIPWFVLLWHPSCYPWGAKKMVCFCNFYRIEHEVKNKLCDTSKQNRQASPQRGGTVASIPEDANKGNATNTPGSQSQTAVF